MAVPADSDKLVTTYGEYRRLARAGALVREGYSIDVQHASAEAEHFREWAMELESLILREHPAGKGVCPGCGKHQTCPMRRATLRLRREMIAEQERANVETLDRQTAHAAARVAHLGTRTPGR